MEMSCALVYPSSGGGFACLCSVDCVIVRAVDSVTEVLERRGDFK